MNFSIVKRRVSFSQMSLESWLVVIALLFFLFKIFQIYPFNRKKFDNLEMAQVKALVQKLIQENAVMVFSKSYCP